jgi:hypothetical protein
MFAASATCFGLSVGAAVRYTAILDHPGLHDVATK